MQKTGYESDDLDYENDEETNKKKSPVEKSEIQKIANQCKRFLKTKEKEKNYKIEIITEPSTSGMYMFGLSKASMDSTSSCSQTNLHRISFLENFQSSCFIKVSKSNITECDQLKEEISKVFVSYLISLALTINLTQIKYITPLSTELLMHSFNLSEFSYS